MNRPQRPEDAWRDARIAPSTLATFLHRRFPQAYTAGRVRWYQFTTAAHRFWNELEEPERGLKRSLSVSVVLHLVLLLIFTIFSAWPRVERWESAPLVVSLVTLPPPTPVEPKTTPPRAVKSKIKLEEKTKKKPEQKKKAEKKPEKKPERKPEPEPPKPPPQKPAPSDTLAQAEPDKSPALVSVRVDEAQFVYDYYLQAVVGKISDAWRPPAGIGERAAETTATLCFRILPQGRVANVEVEAASPIAVFDRSAHAAVLHAQPFPPFPPGYGGKWLTIHLRFAYGD